MIWAEDMSFPEYFPALCQSNTITYFYNAMALFKSNNNLKPEDNTGFGASSNNSGGRFYDRKNDRANVIKRGVDILDRYSWYHTLLE